MIECVNSPPTHPWKPRRRQALGDSLVTTPGQHRDKSQSREEPERSVCRRGPALPSDRVLSKQELRAFHPQVRPCRRAWD